MYARVLIYGSPRQADDDTALKDVKDTKDYSTLPP